MHGAGTEGRDGRKYRSVMSLSGRQERPFDASPAPGRTRTDGPRRTHRTGPRRGRGADVGQVGVRRGAAGPADLSHGPGASPPRCPWAARGSTPSRSPEPEGCNARVPACRARAAAARSSRGSTLTGGRVPTTIRGSLSAEGYPSGQREQTVNLPAHAFVGSNPTPSTSPVEREACPSDRTGERGGCSSMVEPQPSKLMAWVRFPSPAPFRGVRKGYRDGLSAHVAQSAEHVLGKDEVTGSIPVVGSSIS